MKRRKLIKYLEKHGCAFLREGGEHTIYWKPGTDLQSAVPRHSEVYAYMVRKICKDLQIPPPAEK